MLKIKGKVAKMWSKNQMVGLLFDWEAELDKDNIILKTRKYWMDRIAPRYRFVTCSLLLGAHSIRVRIDMQDKELIFNQLVKEDLLELTGIMKPKRGEENG